VSKREDRGGTVGTIDAVVFDLDGVLIDSEPVWEDVRRAYVAERGGRWLPDSQQRLMGMSTWEWARYLAEELGVGEPPAAVAQAVIGRMAQRYATGPPLLPGAVEVARRIARRWPVGLASSSPRRLIDEVLKRTGLASAFSATCSTEEVDRGKPAPDVYLAVAGRLNVAATNCVAVEDSSNGVRSAASAGMVVIAIPRPAYPLDDSARALAAQVLSDLDELPAAFHRLGSPGQRRSEG
jgi:HAD superfamily hydrolase (TIGR01509 family)